MTSRAALIVAAVLLLADCKSDRRAAVEVDAPAFLLGEFVDDYDIRYIVGRDSWVQLPSTRFKVLRWDTARQYIIAKNDAANPADGGLYSRIDWLPLDGYAPYTWAFCYTAYDAISAEAAEAIEPPDRTTPRSGCNGFPFSRMAPFDAD